jgi:hypothetical protein
MRAAIGIVAVAVAAMACGESELAPRTPSPAASVCLEGDGFVESGAMPGGTTGTGDARTVSGLRWAAHEGCERLVVDLAQAGGAPAAQAGRVDAEYRRGLGLVRLVFDPRFGLAPLGEAAGVAPGGRYIAGVYSVWSLDGRLYVDVHMAEATLARVQVLESPARVVVDVRPGGGALPRPAPTGDRVVVVAPREGTVQYPLQVTGYARTFEANVIARVRAGGAVRAQTFTTAASWAETWGEFRLAIESGPAGAIELFVGEESPRDGAEEGVRIDLAAR